MNAYRTYAALAGAVILAIIQYFIHQPWRYVVTSAELTVLIVVVAILWGKTKELSWVTREHQARLDAIANFASKAQVVYDANRIVDAITETLYVHEMREAIDSTE